ncbi:MAG TPA: sulfite exporter TauE/SafE family protein [Candidatus Binatus sp.]|nr:sulfite exporter TauE/SafE family protein [Candidatus Binatus sp.]
MLNHDLWLLPLGLFIGAFGTLIGAGGGFILVPILLLVYPGENTELITSTSLAVVFFNATSGTWAYSRMKRVDYKSGIIFAIATVPGAILGAITTAYVPRHAFDLIFGVLMIAAGIFLWVSARDDHTHGQVAPSEPEKDAAAARIISRDLIDAEGIRYHYSYNPVVGIVLSVFVGYISSVLGVGGGFIHVPALNRLLNFPVHIATATSHFVLAIMALTGTLVHIARGAFAEGITRTAIISVGVVLGAQVGARLSNRVGGKWIIRGLAIALLFVGIRLIMSEL